MVLSLERMETWLQSSDKQKRKGKKTPHLSPPVERTRNSKLNLKQGTFQSNLKKNFPSVRTGKALDSCQISTAFFQTSTVKLNPLGYAAGDPITQPQGSQESYELILHCGMRNG